MKEKAFNMWILTANKNQESNLKSIQWRDKLVNDGFNGWAGLHCGEQGLCHQTCSRCDLCLSCFETNLAIFTKTDNVFESPATQLPKRIR